MMKDTKLLSLGFDMPDDFPVESYNRVNSCFIKYGDTHPIQCRSFGLGWNGVAYRYLAMTEYDQQFATSIKKFGNSPPHEERYKQDNNLFGFFVCAVSTIECFFYSTYWMGVIIKPNEFPSDSQNLKHLYARPIADKFTANFQGDALTELMKLCANDPTFTDMKDMRDVLVHRGMLPRNFHEGGERAGMATMPTNPKDSIDQWQNDRKVDVQTTVSCRQWLGNMLKRLTVAADDFCKQNLK